MHPNHFTDYTDENQQIIESFGIFELVHVATKLARTGIPNITHIWYECFLVSY